MFLFLLSKAAMISEQAKDESGKNDVIDFHNCEISDPEAHQQTAATEKGESHLLKKTTRK